MKNLDLLIPRDRPASDSWRWATVTAAAPLRIRLDGDSDPLDLTPDCLFAGPSVGQRVWVQLAGKRVIVIAPAGGSAVGVAGVKVSNDPPTNPSVGQLWFDSDDPGELTLTAVPALSAYRVASATATANAWTVVGMDTTRDIAGGFTISGGMAVIPRDGWYQVNGNAAFAASTSSARRVVSIISGPSATTFNPLTGSAVASAQDTANYTALSTSGLFKFAAGTFVGVAVFVTTSWSLDVTASWENQLSLAWIGY